MGLGCDMFAALLDTSLASEAPQQGQNETEGRPSPIAPVNHPRDWVVPDRQVRARRMRVAVLSSFFPNIVGGAEASLKTILEAFHKTDVEARVFTLASSKSKAAVTLLPVPRPI